VEIGVLALQGDLREHLAALADLGAAGRPVRLPGDLPGLDGIILPGGESTTMSMLLASAGLYEPLRKELDAGLPAFGTCAGLILLAAAIADGRPDQSCFGAIDLTVRRNGYGRQHESFECDLDVVGLAGGPLHGVFIRAPLVDAAGPGVEVLATLPTPVGVGPVVGGAEARTPVLCRQGSVLVAAFHPELTADRRVHRLFLSMIEQKGP
jgi:pyridoxal 5'-phosphate synthase pdxT subunit